MSSDFRISDEEWGNRQLCSDGNCIGVIGPDGNCKECGKPAENFVVREADKPLPENAETVPTEEDAAPPPADEGAPAEKAAPPEVADDHDHWENRRLCPDGNCIGVIGPDGRCKECGRPAE